jgi:hypothetical protein
VDSLGSWTLIAEAEYRVAGEMARSRWVSVPDAAISVDEAQMLHREGHILMAQKRLPSGAMGLVVKLAKNNKK